MSEVLAMTDKRCEKLARIRGQIEAIEAEIAALDGGALTIDETIANIMADQAEQLEQLRISIAQRTRPGPWGPVVPEPFIAGGGQLPVWASGGIDALTVQRFMLGDEQFEALLRERVAELHLGAGGISLAERRTRRAELGEKIEQLLDDEELELVALEDQGLFAARRPIADDDHAAVRRFLGALCA